MPTVHATKDNFEQLILDNDTVIFDFWAEWCGPCKMFAPIFEAASDKHSGVVFAKVNTDEEPELAGALQIRGIPTTMVFREKVLIFAQAGALPGEALDELLGEVAKLDMEEVHAKVKAAQDAEVAGS